MLEGLSVRHFQPVVAQLGLFLCLMFAIAPAPAHGADSYYIEAARPRVSEHLPQSLIDAVRPQGFRVFSRDDDDKTVVCEIFWARNIAGGKLPSDSTKALYGSIKPGSLVGVIHFLIAERYVRDYRSQVFKAGYYTMRYAVRPEGAGETGPIDFVLLSPVSADRDPSQTVALEELVRRARLASGSKRPAAMSLVETDSDQAFPGLITYDDGTCVLQVKLRRRVTGSAAGQDLPIALVVVTSIPEDLGD